MTQIVNCVDLGPNSRFGVDLMHLKSNGLHRNQKMQIVGKLGKISLNVTFGNQGRYFKKDTIVKKDNVRNYVERHNSEKEYEIRIG